MAMAPLVPKEKEIAGIAFKVTPLPGMKALEMQPRLLHTFAPAFVLAAGSDVVAGLNSFFSRLTPAEYVAITKELLYNTTADDIPLFGPKGCFDSLFAERSHLVPQVLRFAIEEVNFAGFFDEFGANLQKLFARESPTPKRGTPTP